jgi:twitching motility protein PilT
MDFKELFEFAVAHDASDIHIQAGAPPMLRIGGQVRSVESKPLSDEAVREFIASIAPPRERERLQEAATRGLDFSHVVPGLSRFRCSAYRQMGTYGIVMRVIRTTVPSIEMLHLPSVVHDVALSQRGLTLVTGTTGSGKSTTLAAMIDLINDTHRTKIITIEDPIEYLHVNKKALISQIEVGSDTPSFEQALRQALRQDPDVILVGELRDVETLRMALRAADTGHQVFSTVHSANAAQTIERIIAMFPATEHKLLLSQLAGSVEAIISQRLLVTHEGKRRPAVEILRGSAVTEKFIMENRLGELSEYLATGEAGMQSFDQHLLRMHQDDVISGTEALRWATNPESLAMQMRGIRAVGN